MRFIFNLPRQSCFNIDICIYVKDYCLCKKKTYTLELCGCNITPNKRNDKILKDIKISPTEQHYEKYTAKSGIVLYNKIHNRITEDFFKKQVKNILNEKTYHYVYKYMTDIQIMRFSVV